MSHPEPKTEPKSIAPDVLDRFNTFIGQQTGLHFNQSRWPELERGVRNISHAFDFDDPEACILWLMSSASTLSKKQMEILSAHLTIGETYFFREQDTLDMLALQVLPRLIRADGGKSRSLRIWSVACSTGEEPYSIAIILDQKKEQLKDWDITLLATDINIKALEKARSGIYSQWSFRNTPAWIKQQYFFKNEKNLYQIKPHLKQMVSFNYLNLVDDVYPSLVNNTNAMDIIFCRNVLIYFLPQKAEMVVTRLYHSLVMGGWLMVSPADSFHFLEAQCFKRELSSASVFTKCPTKPETVFPLPGPTVPPVVETPPLVTKNKKNNSITGNDSNLTYDRALRCYQEGNYSEVTVLLREQLDRYCQGPKQWVSGDSYALLARSYANLGQLDQAVKWCRKALEKDKLNPGYHYLLVTIFQEQGDQEAAVKSLKHCLYVDPDFILAHFTLGNILKQQKELKQSLRHLDIALTLLEKYADQDVISIEDGLTAGRLREIIKTTVEIRQRGRHDE